MKACGRHVLLELRDCNKEILDNLELIKKHVLEAAIKAKATIVDSSFRKFQPHGVSGFVIIAESHLSVHTWPEYGYAAVDVFTCGNTQPNLAVQYLIVALESKNHHTIDIRRGVMDTDIKAGRKKEKEKEKEGERGKPAKGIPTRCAEFQVLL
jgi:S-adenosylmethionine decarboxylase